MMYEVKYRTMNAMGRYEEFHRCYCDAPQYHGGWMEECYLTVNVSEPEPVDFHIGDFISYRGEEFYINYDPHTIKQARRKSTGDSFKYDNIKFYYLGERLKDIQFLDYVLNDNNKAYSSLPTFSFFADSVEDYADRLQANLDRATDFVTWMVLTPSWMRCQQRCGDVEDAWTRYYNADGSGDYGTWGGEAVVKGNRELNVDVQNTNCWDSLKLSYSKFGLSYFIVGESMTVGHGYIIIGAPPIVVDRVFQYGKGMGLYQIERLPDDDKQIITKLYAYGSEANLPLNYYANIGKKAFVMGVRDIITTGGPPYEYGLKTYNSRSKFARSIKRSDTMCKLRYGDATVYAFADSWDPLPGSGDPFLYLRFYPQQGDVDFYNAIGTDTLVKVYVEEGMDINTLPSEFVELPQDYDYPAMLSLNRLMLPGFPTMSLYDWVANNEDADIRALLSKYVFSQERMDPWVMSKNHASLHVREGVAYYDGNDHKEIKPTIEGTGHDVVVDAQKITDNGVLSENEDITFTITVDDGVDWERSFKEAQDSVVLNMKDGYCVGRDFKVNGVKSVSQSGGLVYQLRCERDPDEVSGRYYPYAYYEDVQTGQDLFQVKGGENGDHFVVTGIDMPPELIEAASRQLLIAACGYLDKVDHTVYTYVPHIDEIEMMRQHERYEAGVDGISIHDTLRAGMQLKLSDMDLGISHTAYIDSLTIKEDGNNGIPTYEVVLRDEKEVSFKDAIIQQISELRVPTVAPVERRTQTLQIVDRGEWELHPSEGYHYESVNSETGVWETSDVWHNGCRWRCLIDQPRTGQSGCDEPGWKSPYWTFVEGNNIVAMEIDTQGIFAARSGYVDIPATAYVFFGYTDVSGDIVAWEWSRESDNPQADLGWKTAHEGAGRSIHLTDEDMPVSWHQGRTVVFECTAYLPDGTTQSNRIIM